MYLSKENLAYINRQMTAFRRRREYYERDHKRNDDRRNFKC